MYVAINNNKMTDNQIQVNCNTNYNNDHGMNISPLDGRYRHVVDPLREYFSEYGYMKQRFLLELDYLEFFLLCVKKE